MPENTDRKAVSEFIDELGDVINRHRPLVNAGCMIGALEVVKFRVQYEVMKQFENDQKEEEGGFGE